MDHVNLWFNKELKLALIQLWIHKFPLKIAIGPLARVVKILNAPFAISWFQFFVV